MINVQVWDKANVSAVDQAIRTSDLNLNPIVDGQLLRIAIPKLTEERRKELIKVLKTIAEKAKVAIRNIRRDSLEELKKEQKDKNLSEDDLKKNSNEVQKITDLKIAEIDKILVGKLKKVISDNTLMGQKWIHNQDITVEQAVNDFGKEIKQNLMIKSFIKYKVGEGIEVKKTDFNEEVKSLAGA